MSRRVSLISTTAVAACVGLVPALASAQLDPPYLVKDIARPSLLTGSSFGTTANPSLTAVIGSIVYFGVTNDVWATDGTVAGTSKVVEGDLLAPTLGSLFAFTAIGNGQFVFFTGNTATANQRCWISDGTQGGTVQVGTTGAVNLPNPIASPILLYDEMSGPGDPWRIFFAGQKSITETELCTIAFDGTNYSASVFFEAGVGTTNGFVSNVAWLDRTTSPRKFLFSASNVAGVYVSDGTVPGTVKLNPAGSPSSIATNGGIVQTSEGTAVFTASTVANGVELWKTDGTDAGTLQLPNIGTSPGVSASAFPTSTPGVFTAPIVALGGDVYVWATFNGNNNRRELWKVTTAGAGTVTQLTTLNGSATLAQLTTLGVASNKIFFAPGTPIATPGALRELRASDGTVGNGVSLGSVRVPDASTSSSSDPATFFGVGSRLYFSGNLLASGTELWVTDGTLAGTSLVEDVNPIETSSPLPMAGFDLAGTPRLLVGLDDGTSGREPWVSDGTAAGTFILADPQPSNPGSVVQIAPNNRLAISAFGKYYISVNDGRVGNEVWASDGTSAGTALFADLVAGVSSSFGEFFAEVNGRLYFRGTSSGNGYEIYRTDGTSTPVRISDINSGAANANPQGFQAFAGGLLFFAFSAANGWEPVYSANPQDATPTFTQLNINPAAANSVNGGCPGGNCANGFGTNSVVIESARAGTKVVFAADNGVNGIELWAIDESAPTTPSLVLDINPGAAGSNPTGFIAFNGFVYFAASDGVNGIELWRTDGTPAGTTLVKDINPLAPSGSPSSFAVSNGLLFFSADDGTNGFELWASDGTTAGTALVADVYPFGPSTPRNLTVFGNRVIFRASDDGGATNGVFISDGTLAGTDRLGTATTRADGIAPEFYDAGGLCFFRGTDGGVGQLTQQEVYVTDGTDAGTQQVSDIEPTQGSSPEWFRRVGDRLLFVAGNFELGFRELYAFDLPSPCPLDLSGNDLVDADDIFAFLNIWFAGPPGGSCSGCTADFDGNGLIDADDIFAFLNAWFAFGPGLPCP